jgi:hypothetical protein
MGYDHRFLLLSALRKKAATAKSATDRLRDLTRIFALHTALWVARIGDTLKLGPEGTKDQ